MSNYLVNHLLFLVLFISLFDDLQVFCRQSTFNYSNVNRLNNYQLISSNHLDGRFKRAVTSKPEKKWKDAIIPYEIEKKWFTEHELSVIKEAMLYWENYTCIKFVERRPEHEDYIFITHKKCGCCSIVGRKGGPQDVSLAPSCRKFGTLLHEFGHTIGFWHEHTRPDREQNVAIVLSNVQDNQTHNFNMMNNSEIDSLGSPYDFESIMHYSSNTFSKHRKLDTIKSRYRIDNLMGQRERLSKQDIKQANLLYKCPINGQTIEQTRGTLEFNEFLY